MRRFIPDLPRNVTIALATIVTSALLFALLFWTLGAARDEAIAGNARLTSEIQQARNAANQAAQDRDYVLANQAKYEALLKGNSLIPHTRRAAVVELQRVARERGLTMLNYSFQAAAPEALKSVQSQSTTAGYRLSVEVISLKVGAPVDGAVYGVMADITDAFPGSAVIERVVLSRPPEITDEALQAVSEGKDSKLVSGEIFVSWRTAQAQGEKAGATVQDVGRPK